MKISVVILAAGHGKRMNSSMPKVLHTLAGKTMLEHVCEKANFLTSEPPIVVYGYQGEKVRAALEHKSITWVQQTEQLGTGHAALQALSFIPEDHHVLILYGDVPLISIAMLKKFITETPSDALGIITAYFPDPTGIGRILRAEQNCIVGVIEEKDASDLQRQIKEVNTGFYFAPVNCLRRWLPKLNNCNVQQEYYLTDIVGLAVEDSVAVVGMMLDSHWEALGINTAEQLREAEGILSLHA